MSAETLPNSLDDRVQRLRETVRSLGSCLVAFSGGVDSSLLAKVCWDELGQAAVAVTVASQIHPAFELEDAKELARAIGIRHEVVEADAFAIPGIADNPPDRCYHCKKTVFGRLGDMAREWGLAHVVDGSNADDAGDYRPGARAAEELGVRSPLAEAGMGKQDVRRLSKDLGLPTWDKPSYACLASRVPYGEPITPRKLHMIDAAEAVLRGLGFEQSRVRHHGAIARIEVEPSQVQDIARGEARREVVTKLKALGFQYVTLDLGGYRTGSMNAVLTREDKGPDA